MKNTRKRDHNASPIRTIRQFLREYPLTKSLGTQRGFSGLAGFSTETLQLLEYGKLKISERIAALIGEAFYIDQQWLLVAGPNDFPIAADGRPWNASYFLSRTEDSDTEKPKVRGVDLDEFSSRYARLTEGMMLRLLERGRPALVDIVSEAMVRFLEEAYRATNMDVDVWGSMRGENEDRTTSDSQTGKLARTANPFLMMYQQKVGSLLDALVKDQNG